MLRHAFSNITHRLCGGFSFRTKNAYQALTAHHSFLCLYIDQMPPCRLATQSWKHLKSPHEDISAGCVTWTWTVWLGFLLLIADCQYKLHHHHHHHHSSHAERATVYWMFLLRRHAFLLPLPSLNQTSWPCFLKTLPHKVNHSCGKARSENKHFS